MRKKEMPSTTACLELFCLSVFMGGAETQSEWEPSWVYCMPCPRTLSDKFCTATKNNLSPVLLLLVSQNDSKNSCLEQNGLALGPVVPQPNKLCLILPLFPALPIHADGLRVGESSLSFLFRDNSLLINPSYFPLLSWMEHPDASILLSHNPLLGPSLLWW